MTENPNPRGSLLASVIAGVMTLGVVAWLMWLATAAFFGAEAAAGNVEIVLTVLYVLAALVMLMVAGAATTAKDPFAFVSTVVAAVRALVRR